MGSDDSDASSSDDHEMSRHVSKNPARSDSNYGSPASYGGSFTVGHKGSAIVTRESHPNYWQIVESQGVLVPYNLEQLRALQVELGIIGSGVGQTLHQLEREKAHLDSLLRQRSHSSYGADFVDPDDAVGHGSGGDASPTKADERGTRIRTTTPIMREHLDQLKAKRKGEFENEWDDKKRRQSIDYTGEVAPQEDSEDAPLSMRMKMQDSVQGDAEESDPTDKRKKKKNDPKQRRRGGKSTGGKSVSGKSVSTDGETKEGGGGVIEATTVVAAEEDSLKPKIANQISYETFTKFVEPFVKTLSEEDLSLLEITEDDPYPYIVPRLGKRFSEQWHQDFQASEPHHQHAASPSSSYMSGDTSMYGAHWRSEDPWCRPVTQRILAALMEEQVVDIPKVKDEDKSDTLKSVVQTAEDYERLEERIKEELRILGLLGEEEVAENEREDDEISFQLRYLQDSLRKQVAVNNTRKAKIMERAKAHLAFQEYEQLVSEVHKQIEKAHVSRLQKPGKKSKKKEKLRPVPEQSIKLMRDSDRLLKKLEKVFPREKYLPPKESVFKESAAEGNQNPFAFLDTLHYMGMPRPTDSHRRKLNKLAVNASGLLVDPTVWSSAVSSPITSAPTADIQMKD